MRVRIVTPFAAYWNYAIQQFEQGEEFDGDLARHLDDNSPDGSVETIEADLEPPQAEPEQEPLEPSDELDIDATATDVLAWVGDDPERAAEALEAETAKDKPRSTLVKQLEKLAAVDPGE